MSFKPILYKVLAATMVITIVFISGCNLQSTSSNPTATAISTVIVPTENVAPTLDMVRTQAVHDGTAHQSYFPCVSSTNHYTQQLWLWLRGGIRIHQPGYSQSKHLVRLDLGNQEYR